MFWPRGMKIPWIISHAIPRRLHGILCDLQHGITTEHDVFHGNSMVYFTLNHTKSLHGKCHVFPHKFRGYKTGEKTVIITPVKKSDDTLPPSPPVRVAVATSRVVIENLSSPSCCRVAGPVWNYTRSHAH